MATDKWKTEKGSVCLVLTVRVSVRVKKKEFLKTKNYGKFEGQEGIEYSDFKLIKKGLPRITQKDIIRAFDNTPYNEYEDTYEPDEE